MEIQAPGLGLLHARREWRVKSLEDGVRVALVILAAGLLVAAGMGISRAGYTIGRIDGWTLGWIDGWQECRHVEGKQ